MFDLGRGKLWTGQTRGLLQNMYASDGFMLNLCTVLLQFCQPFSNPASLTFPTTAAKILKVAPSYCLATAGSDEDRTAKCVHCKGNIDQCVPITPTIQMTATVTGKHRVPINNMFHVRSWCTLSLRNHKLF